MDSQIIGETTQQARRGTLGNPSKGKVTSQSDCQGDQVAQSTGNQDYGQAAKRPEGRLSKALAMDQELLCGGFMGKDQEN